MAEQIQTKCPANGGEGRGGLAGLVNKAVELTASAARQITYHLKGDKEKAKDKGEGYGPRVYNAFQLETEFAGNGHYDSCQGGGGCQCQSGCQCQRRD